MLTQLRAGQRRFVRLLPALLSLNHKHLPGYVGGDAACGVQGYVPNADIQAELTHRFACDIKPAHRTLKCDVLNISLMGSIASIGHGEDSDIDVWVVHREDLPPAGRAQLQQRLAAIGDWSRTLGIHTQCFVVDPKNFAQQPPLTASPNALLLDEYLRTATVIAGGYPAAWLVDPEREADSPRITQTLNAQLPADQQLVDFGPLAMPDTAALVEHALGQIAASIESPWKAVLKLNLASHYANGGALLSHAHRQALQTGRQPPDPYVAMLTTLSESLQAPAQAQRLALIRRALYLKTGVRLSHPSLQVPGWQHHQIHQLVKDWGWSHADIAQIDHARGWSLDQIQQMHQALVSELTLRFHTLADQCHWQGLAPAGDQRLDRVARKLYARFEPKPGKLAQLHPSLVRHIQRQPLTLEALPHGPWRLTQDQGAEHFHTLTQALVWAHIHGLAVRGDCAIMPAAQGALNQHLPTRSVSADFDAPARCEQMLWIAKPAAVGSEGLRALAWIDVVSRNSWGEVRCRRYTGASGYGQALAECLTELLECELSPAGLNAVFEPDPVIDAHLSALAQAQAFFARPDFRAGCYVMQVDGRFVLLSWQENQPQVRVLDDVLALMDWLKTPSPQFRALQLDDSCQLPPELHTLASQGQNGRIQFYLRAQQGGVRVWCCDERGSILSFTQPQVSLAQASAHLQGFTQRLLMRRQPATLVRYRADQTPQLQIYWADGTQWEAQPLRAQATPEFAVAAHGQWSSEGAVEFEIHIGEARYSALTHGQDYIRAAAAQIQTHRASGEHYPAHLTDLSLPRHADPWGVQPMQTVEYLAHKLNIEKALAAAMAP